MGTIKQGILGGFSGRVGTVVGSTWKSVHYMRALAVSVNNPNTEKQQSQRNKFSTALNFLKTMTPFVRIGYKNYTKDQSAFNAASGSRYNIRQLVSGILYSASSFLPPAASLYKQTQPHASHCTT